MSELQVEALVKVYPGREELVAVNNVDIEVQAGEMLVLLGPSGCGKTTLLRCIAGLEDAQRGRIALEGTTVFDAAIGYNQPTHLRDIGMAFQNYSLWPHMTIHRNVEYPLRARGIASDARERRVNEVLEVVQCAHLAERLPSMLSGGQQQRIALARALASQPKIMLLDEPLSNLDALLRVELRAQLRRIHRELGFTGIYVTHDQVEAFNLGTRVAVMKAGRIEQLGDARDVYDRPATEYVAKFLRISNSLNMTFDGGWTTNAGRLEGDLGILVGRGSPMQMYVRPTALALTPQENTLGECPGTYVISGGRIVDTLCSGGEVDYIVDMNGVTLSASLRTAQATFNRDDRVRVSFRHQDALIYSEGRLIESRMALTAERPSMSAV